MSSVTFSGDSTRASRPDGRTLVLAVIALMAAIGSIYHPVYGFDFLEYDDRLYVFDNPDIKDGLTGHAVHSAFTTSYVASWHPLSILSHAMDVQLFGMNAGAHHLVNVALHAVNSVLLLLVLYRLTGRTVESICVAALFAVHPQHVEPVAWISSRKDLLSTFFMLACIACYSNYVRKGGWHRYLPVAAMLTAGLLSKSILVTLPCVLLLLDVWPLNRLRDVPSAIRCAAEKIPLFAICGVVAYTTHSIVAGGGITKSLEEFPAGERAAHVVVSYATYVLKAIWPTGLAAFYPREIAAHETHVIAAAAIGLAVISGITILYLRSRPQWFVGWFWFCGTLVPVIGIVQFGNHGMADRYTYIAHIGLFVAIVWALRELVSRHRQGLRVASVVAIAALVAYTGAAASYTRVWKNDIELFRQARRVTPINTVLVTNMTLGMMQRGMWEEALHVFRTGLDAWPPFGNQYNNIAICYTQLGRTDLAFQAYVDGMAHDPHDPLVYANVERCRRQLRSMRREIALLLVQYAEKPGDAVLLRELATRWTATGQLDSAAEALEYLRNVELESPGASVALGRFYYRAGRSELAVAEFTRSLALGAEPREVLYNLAGAQYSAGMESDARKTLQDAVGLMPPTSEPDLMLERIDNAANSAFDARPVFRASPIGP